MTRVLMAAPLLGVKEASPDCFGMLGKAVHRHASRNCARCVARVLDQCLRAYAHAERVPVRRTGRCDRVVRAPHLCSAARRQWGRRRLGRRGAGHGWAQGGAGAISAHPADKWPGWCRNWIETTLIAPLNLPRHLMALDSAGEAWGVMTGVEPRARAVESGHPAIMPQPPTTADTMPSSAAHSTRRADACCASRAQVLFGTLS